MPFSLDQRAQQRVPALGKPTLTGEPVGRTAAGSVSKQAHEARDPTGPPREGRRQLRRAAGEGLARTGRVAAPPPRHDQVDRGLRRLHRKVAQPARIRTVHRA